MTLLSLDSIRLDGGTQPRGHLVQQQVESYAQDMQAGMTFPPIEVIYDGQDYWLWDGFHRVHACRSLGRQQIEANVASGTQADAQWLSYSANRAHGIQRSNEDKRRAVLAALRHSKGANCSDRQIADHVGVHFDTVAKYRKGLESAGTIGKSDSRTGRDGRTIATAKIGKPAARKKPNRCEISPEALTPVRGHSQPRPRTVLELPHDPVWAAKALISTFDRPFLTGLVSEITLYLEGESK